ncbi:hypothetical protein [Xanthomonas sp. 3307]|uniref:TRAFAC clade GTPase domain-containing protein n=1 Tax=Xanthomonas sp. 3307 TaxID=3035316 RepID=UPI001607F2C5|nr:hypothetical protein [Xanthomonas sp. 3307]MBB5942854.1 GTP-binding protein EngB required for normal cell division [Xanthomonas sp. 3307]
MSQEDKEFDVYNDDDEEITLKPVAELAMANLCPGEALTLKEVSEFLLARAATFVAIVGERNSGKSTIICALYDRFLRGAFGGFSFAGSKSLIAFERRAHYSRASSGLEVPDTARTSLDEDVHYFHLALVDENQTSRTDIFLSDRAGETYESARANTTLVSRLHEIPQACRVVVLLDGERVANPMQRSNAIHAVRQMIRALLDNDAIGRRSIVQVVTTKADLISGSKDAAAIQSHLDGFARELRRDVESRVSELTFWSVTARDPSGQATPASGLDTLLRDWLTPKPQSREQANTPPLPLLRTEFDKLVLRVPTKAVK